MNEATENKAADAVAGQAQRVVMRRCAACDKEKPLSEMKTCMDSRPMHRYVCNTECMIQFYA